MNSAEVFQSLIPLESGLAGAMGAAFWVKKWITRTDKTLNHLTREVQKMRTKLEVLTQIDNVNQGRMDEARKSLIRVSEKLEKTANAVDTLWYLVDRNKDVFKRT